MNEVINTTASSDVHTRIGAASLKELCKCAEGVISDSCTASEHTEKLIGFD